jgi:nucleoside triphosphate pyrophosphatase
MTLLDLGDRRLVLASASPRRADLLRSVGLEFDVVPADIDESVLPGETPTEYVERLSVDKARAVAQRLDAASIVVAADTTVDVDGRILEKPVDDDDARRMLGLLSGRVHLVHTGVTVRGPDGSVSRVVETAVEFVTLSPASIDWYIATAEPFDKAGAYAIQGAGGALVRRLDGSVTNVIGLPLAETLELIAARVEL